MEGIYNNQRPHSPLRRRPPATIYDLLPKATPRGASSGVHQRDRVDKTGIVSLRRAGRLHHIGTGRAHTAKTVLALIDDLDIRVIATTTGQLLRHLTLNPTRNNQPRNDQGPNPHRRLGPCRCLATSHLRSGWDRAWPW